MSLWERIAKRKATKERGTMPTFADIATVRRGTDPVPDWREIMDLGDEAHARAIAGAAHHVWMWVSARARQGDAEFSPANLAYIRGKPVFSANESVRSGWRWDGVFTNVFVALWPSLNGKLGHNADTSDPDVLRARLFRGQVASYLKRSQNVVNVYSGAPKAHDPGMRIPKWFIAATWDATPPPRSPKSSSPKPPGKAALAAEARAARLTPEEAGEDRAPAPVSVEYTCRKGCADRFPDAAARKEHEDTVHRREAAAPPAGRYPCPVCGAPSTTSGNRRAHQKARHPETIRDLPYQCKVPGCPEAYDTRRGLSQHLGVNGPHVLTAPVRGAMITQAVEEAEDRLAGKASGEPEGAVEAPVQQRASVPSVRAAEPVAAAQELPAAKPAPSDDADAAVLAIQELLADRSRLQKEAARVLVLEAEARRLRAKLAQAQQAMRAFTAAFEDDSSDD